MLFNIEVIRISFCSLIFSRCFSSEVFFTLFLFIWKLVGLVILHTGGSAFSAINTKSNPLLSANFTADAVSMILETPSTSFTLTGMSYTFIMGNRLLFFVYGKGYYAKPPSFIFRGRSCLYCFFCNYHSFNSLSFICLVIRIVFLTT